MTTPADFIAYLRVSTQKQGQSGLGLEAQRAAVAAFARHHGGKIIEEYIEIESGKRSERPQLAKAMAAAKKANATLLIAKLDRLSPDVHFISGLMKGVDFLAVDQPFANQLTLHILAAVAEDEARRISERTRAALRAARARGVKLGSPKGAETIAAARDARSRYARRTAGPIKMIIADIQNAGVTSLSDIAKALQARGMRTPAGKTNWHASQVARLLAK
jgi:DNA invertase Pin-like site-specific DNA recombinase